MLDPENAKMSPKHSSVLQALALSNIEEGMGHKLTRAQGLHKELAQRRASLLQDLYSVGETANSPGAGPGAATTDYLLPSADCIWLLIYFTCNILHFHLVLQYL